MSKTWVTQKAIIPFHLPTLSKNTTPIVLLRDPGTPKSEAMSKAEREVISSLRPGASSQSKPAALPPLYAPVQASSVAESSKPIEASQPLQGSAREVTGLGTSARPALTAQKRRIEAVSSDDDDPQPIMKHRKPQPFPLDVPVNPETLEFEPASSKAPFPTKYFRFMERGLNRVSDPTTSDLYGKVSDKFQQHFGFPWKRTAYHKHLNTLRYAPDELKDYFRQLEVSENSTWKAFRKIVVSIYVGDQDISARLSGVGSEKGKNGQTQRKAGPTGAAIAAAKRWVNDRTAKPHLGLVPVEEGAEEISTSTRDVTISSGPSCQATTTLDNPDSPSAFVAGLMASTTLKICTTCDKALPDNPSDMLAALQSATLATPASATLSVKFCEQHWAEAVWELVPEHMRWPKSIDFLKLGERLESLKEDLEEIWTSPESSQFYEAHLESVEKLGTHRKAASIRGDDNFIGTA